MERLIRSSELMRPVAPLTKMYSETKRYYETITEPKKTENTPELHSLHRKLRIQKDRLITWGLDWSDEAANRPGDIDEKIQREGLSGVVSSVMSSIKEMLEDAESIEARKTAVAFPEKKEKGLGEKGQIRPGDKRQFEDLVNDLTTSIDTLYDLSRSRRALRENLPGQSHEQGSAMGAYKKSASWDNPLLLPPDTTETHDFPTPSASSVPTTPGNFISPPSLKIDASSIVFPGDSSWPAPEPPSRDRPPPPGSQRTMGYLRMAPTSSISPWKERSGPLMLPVLIEYCPYDPIYSSTGVHLSIDPLEELASVLHHEDDETHPSMLKSLNLVGYFEDPEYSRYGLAYQLPKDAYRGPEDAQKPLHTMAPISLREALQPGPFRSGSSVPCLEDRFRAAHTLAATFFHLHTKGISHRDVQSENILLFPKASLDSSPSISNQDLWDLRNPYLASYDLFSEYSLEDSTRDLASDMYRHPGDLGGANGFHPSFDLYGLGLLLLEIGLWLPIGTLWKPKYDRGVFKSRIVDIHVKKLLPKCGKLYTLAVRSCLLCADEVHHLEDEEDWRQKLQIELYWNVVRRLERCCAIDDTDEERSSTALALERPTPTLSRRSSVSVSSVEMTEASTPTVIGEPYSRETTAMEEDDLVKDFTEVPDASTPTAVGTPTQVRSPSNTPVRTDAIEDTKLHLMQSERAFGASHPHSLRLATTLALQYRLKGQYDQAEVIHERVLNDYRQTMGVDHPDALEAAMHLAHVKIDQAGRLSSSEGPSKSKNLPHHSPAQDYLIMNMYQKICRLLETVLVARQKTLGYDHEDTLQTSREFAKAFKIVQELEAKTKTFQSQPYSRDLDIDPATGSIARARLSLGVDEAPEVDKKGSELEMISQNDMEYSLLSIPDEEASRLLEEARNRELMLSTAAPVRNREKKSASPSAAPVARLKIHPVKILPSHLEEWHSLLLPRLEHLLTRALKTSMETVTIDLIGVGETPFNTRPTIFVTCSSVGKVKGVLSRRFAYDKSVFDLKVRRGKLRRSSGKKARRKKRTLPLRSGAGADDGNAVMNPFHQQRPLNGASIGAYRDEEHLPPVSYGGVVLLDGEPYGMTVHHSLDAPSEEESDEEDDADVMRSSANWYSQQQAPGFESMRPWLPDINTDDRYDLFEISDEDDAGYDSAYNEDYDTDFDDDVSESEESDVDEAGMPWGNVPGIDVEDGPQYLITQPAIDDVDDNFFPNDEERDEEHLDSHTLGHVHASSGVRRWKRNGIKHEIDWALLKVSNSRLQPHNLIQGGRRFSREGGAQAHPDLLDPVCRHPLFKPEEDLYPTAVAPGDQLGNLEVHCLGRTSGLQGGMISPAMSSVKVFGRRSYSRSWHVMGRFGG